VSIIVIIIIIIDYIVMCVSDKCKLLLLLLKWLLSVNVCVNCVAIIISISSIFYCSILLLLNNYW